MAPRDPTSTQPDDPTPLLALPIHTVRSPDRLQARYAPHLVQPAALHDLAWQGQGAALPLRRSNVLVVDDYAVQREVLTRTLKRLGHAVVTASNGRQALDLLRQQSFDLMLLDIMMPEMTGYELLAERRNDPQLRDVPVVVISGIEDLASIVRCIQEGAEDYLFKPFDPVLLEARISACLEKKRLRDQERAFFQQLQLEQERTERLLLNILPSPIAQRLKQDQPVLAESFEDVSVLFADIVNFTAFAARVSATDVVSVLNQIFSLFDQLAERHNLEKIKTIGDAYMVASGLPTPRPDHAQAIARMALDMHQAIAQFNDIAGETFQLRIGISSGPAVAGVIGTKKFIYDLWGDTVNTASRMESHGLPGHIQVSSDTYGRLHDQFLLHERGPIDIKGKGQMVTYFLLGPR